MEKGGIVGCENDDVLGRCDDDDDDITVCVLKQNDKFYVVEGKEILFPYFSFFQGECFHTDYHLVFTISLSLA